ncbi:NADH dehydrogenase subunit 4 (mitochondrion) [Saccoglossus kowalevskii]|uniref:NADH-ubiquinone oxidoreductase chain 4 n=1 Tax=Saccoglossus kowalevskii TaxID=10224 RepID=Q3L8T3_SACKO|nr:NADH dehydrogenase subunit 4 [Saccoglossus kowalevskii]AAQ92985.1 NADH dehydrogenase subunit 4 [Saccoglossus kowalevskii]
MLTLTFFSLGITITALIVPGRWLWPSLLVQSSILPLITLILLLPHHSSSTWHTLSTSLATDSLSSPLIILSAWLLPLSLLASRQHLSKEPLARQRSYLTLLSSLVLSLIITFSALDLILFYIAFEATLVPTLIVITRWGNQPERLQAGTYFLFYTLFGSFPLLISLLSLLSLTSSASIPLSSLNDLSTLEFSNPSLALWWIASIIAFLAKLPIYGLHLWLPKAHVEAPIAGSMILAAILLKLGGYGLVRITALFSLPNSFASEPIITFCIWGGLITSIICIRQTDMKALIAYSSVGHMSLVAAGIFSETTWGLNGALILMIAHGLISSALFCLANLSYERTFTRTLSLNRGLKLITPLSAAWWLIVSAANLALPPTPNFSGELLIVTNLISWNPWTALFLGLTALFTAIYSLYLYQSSQHSPNPSSFKKISQTLTIEHLNIFLHLTPLILLIGKPELISLAW